ncbi:hypothetical protein ACTNEW_05050 [Blautia sp. HCP3S3_G3]|uniref:hypothetical protein n=1 Tax=Blautia sp. HCP3S3_G3 TaxID=3438913 RepID=UPI003F8A91CC
MNSYVYILILPYICWSASYFFCSVLKPRRFLNHPILTVFLLLMVSVPAVMLLKTQNVTIGTISIQLLFLGIVFIFYCGTVSRKLACYFIYAISLTLVEILACNILVLIRPLWAEVPIAFNEIYFVTDTADILCVSLADICIGVLCFQKESALLKRCFSYLHLKTFLQLLYPVYLPIIAQQVIISLTEYSLFPALAAAYWILCLISYPVFRKGIHVIQTQEEAAIFRQHQLQLMKEQLSLSREMEKEYQALRKWNHDVENHLLSLSYLMDMEKYEQAASYCCSINTENTSGNTHFERYDNPHGGHYESQIS